MSKRTTTVRIDEELLTGLQAIKDRDGVPISEQIRRAIDSWLESKGIMKSERKRVAARKRP
jgi:hypothetical protein